MYKSLLIVKKSYTKCTNRQPSKYEYISNKQKMFSNSHFVTRFFKI